MGDKWRMVLWFMLAVFLGLMFLPRNAVFWGLLVVAVGVVFAHVPEITGKASSGAGGSFGPDLMSGGGSSTYV